MPGWCWPANRCSPNIRVKSATAPYARPRRAGVCVACCTTRNDLLAVRPTDLYGRPHTRDPRGPGGLRIVAAYSHPRGVGTLLNQNEGKYAIVANRFCRCTWREFQGSESSSRIHT